MGPKLRYQRLLSALYPNIAEIKVEEKAEDTFPAVAAVSVIAKYLRDTQQGDLNYHKRGESPEAKALIDAEGSKPGSGYPGDEDTMSWPQLIDSKFTTYPSTVRRSWQTIQKRLAIKVELDEYKQLSHLQLAKD